MAENDPVNHPSHYTSHPSGIECIQITEHMNFNLGNALKYIWRADLKGKSIEDLEKAQFYINRELALKDTITSEQKNIQLSVGKPVFVYDRYRFAIRLTGVIKKLSDSNDGVCVELTQSNSAAYPVGKQVWVHAQQIVVHNN